MRVSKFGCPDATEQPPTAEGEAPRRCHSRLAPQQPKSDPPHPQHHGPFSPSVVYVSGPFRARHGPGSTPTPGPSTTAAACASVSPEPSETGSPTAPNIDTPVARAISRIAAHKRTVDELAEVHRQKKRLVRRRQLRPRSPQRSRSVIAPPAMNHRRPLSGSGLHRPPRARQAQARTVRSTPRRLRGKRPQ
ncbi:hypothetical protein PR003_g17971 [Phytophthora rubi]|uniref:Uncharacterized protein n=1 Tax=Phytophthora rubi TaxID=129364 RepID=A0A6A4EAK3_9STRA|nr:hypothetical protein PR003_g17971 [Phytophthora rubi]